MKDQYDSIHEFVTTRLKEGYGKESNASDLHHHLCNEDYFIIGTFKAKQFLGSSAFDIIQKIKEYEQSNFGECTTDLSDAEKVANMFAYIVGEEILCESDHLNDCWNNKALAYNLTDEDHAQITLEIASVNIAKVYNSN